MIQVFVFNILFCFDMFEIFLSTGWVGLLDRLINKQIKHIYTVQALQSTVICHQNQNVHIRLPTRKTKALNQSSISLHPTPIRSFVSLICGENTYCSFSVVLNQDLSNKNEKFQRLRSKMSEEVIPNTILTVYTYILCM